MTAVNLSRDFSFAGGCGCGALPWLSRGGALLVPGRRDVLGLSGLAFGSWRRRACGAGADRGLIKVPNSQPSRDTPNGTAESSPKALQQAHLTAHGEPKTHPFYCRHPDSP
jgi:hypothetical protein